MIPEGPENSEIARSRTLSANLGHYTSAKGRAEIQTPRRGGMLSEHDYLYHSCEKRKGGLWLQLGGIMLRKAVLLSGEKEREN